eukprot:CAMPEP_0185273740 /NCGR_PEP_ID=MMETSP1359-20130426/50254_1 /TAXON_ID=552665 /ORGANISM="Bigelowiella longifila, Strain CCMP242" /LENGTH=75 /DNA_ID=CAMNT_0027866479 /DNA_START=517 /DNA_END=741 /DNA_ORIENTATION=-
MVAGNEHDGLEALGHLRQPLAELLKMGIYVRLAVIPDGISCVEEDIALRYRDTVMVVVAVGDMHEPHYAAAVPSL